MGLETGLTLAFGFTAFIVNVSVLLGIYTKFVQRMAILEVHIETLLKDLERRNNEKSR